MVMDFQVIECSLVDTRLPLTRARSSQVVSMAHERCNIREHTQPRDTGRDGSIVKYT